MGPPSSSFRAIGASTRLGWTRAACTTTSCRSTSCWTRLARSAEARGFARKVCSIGSDVVETASGPPGQRLAPVDPARLSAIVKAYDIRGVVPEQLDADISRGVGAAFVELLRGEGELSGMVVGYDMRPTSPDLAHAFPGGGGQAGVDVTIIGLASTDELYCASGLRG